jgi:hypothetical protein
VLCVQSSIDVNALRLKGPSDREPLSYHFDLQNISRMKRLALIIVFYICSSGLIVHGQSGPLRLSERQQAKTEHLIGQLEQLGAIASTNPQYDEYRFSVRRVSVSIKEAASKLPESDIKTDLLTALYLYERVLSDWHELETHRPLESTCASERPGADISLCQNTYGSQKECLWKKAHCHTVWARAVLYSGKSVQDDALTKALPEMHAERKLDLMLARNAIEALKELQEDVIVYRSLGEFEEGRSLARVSFENFTEHLRRISPVVKRLLSLLPENRLKLELRNALLSYMDGGFWWSKVYSPAVINVAGRRFAAGEPTLLDKAYLSTDLYTVAINWRQGSQHLKRAEEILNALS